jgi:hypothetical protein
MKGQGKRFLLRVRVGAEGATLLGKIEEISRSGTGIHFGSEI